MPASASCFVGDDLERVTRLLRLSSWANSNVPFATMIANGGCVRYLPQAEHFRQVNLHIRDRTGRTRAIVAKTGARNRSCCSWNGSEKQD